MKKYNTRSVFKFDSRKAYKLGLKQDAKKIIQSHGYKIVNYERLSRLDCVLVEVEPNRIQIPEYMERLTPCWTFGLKKQL